MFSRFFIDRPIFAAVLSIVITLGGGLAAFNLPLAQYPPVAPPVVQVKCNYPGASAQVVAATVAAPIEERVNGVENMLYMVSQCTNDGSYNLTVTFKHGVNLNLAQVLVQNRVNLAMPRLPDVLKRTTITTRKMAPDILMSVNLKSPDDRYDQLYLSNYALLHIRDELLRLPGISDVVISGQRDYSMRVWVDPGKLASRNLTSGDVVKAIREQNVQVAVGQVGQPPVVEDQPTQITLTTLGRLKEPGQFEEIIIARTREGRLTRLKDVARVELGARNEDVSARLDGLPTAGLIIFQLPDANALDLADHIHEKMDELAKDFPEGLAYEIQYDTTPYTRECISEVRKALRDAVVLVALVVLLFLQNWRSAVIPLLTVPVAIVGTFGVMAMMGFSLNNLTLFGLVLAIGIVVDNAIVVVEAVEHNIERGLAPREAAIKAMSQLSSPVIAVGLVLSAIFVPCAFIPGITGQFFRQFALTIAASTIISTFNSLTLSPALSAILLRQRDKETHEALPRLAYPTLCGWLGYLWLLPAIFPETARHASGSRWWLAAALAVLPAAALGWLIRGPANRVLGWLFHGFNAAFEQTTHGYVRAVGGLLRHSAIVLACYGGLLLLTGYEFRVTPKGFIPPQDMGYLMLGVQLPDAMAVGETRKVTKRVQDICLRTPGVKHTVAQAGNSFLLNASAPNFGSMFVILDDFANRRRPELTAERIAASIRQQCAKAIPGAMVMVQSAPPVRGVSRTGGFKYMVEYRGNSDLMTLQQQADYLVTLAEKEQTARGPAMIVQPNVFRASTPQLFADVDRAACMTMGNVNNGDVSDTLQTYLGSLYVNDFNLFDRTWQVVVQADGRFRNQLEMVSQLKVRNSFGDMVPIGSVAKVRNKSGPLMITRYNMYPAVAVQGQPVPGVSSRTAIDIMQRLAEQIPTMRCEWTELAYLELQAGNTAMAVFLFAVVMVFLVLAAQYESWSLPLAVILVVPMCLLSAIAGVQLIGMDINIFTQIGFVVLVGLASKNAILIVEYAKHQREEGMSRRDAAMAACRLRLRPIVMTSFAFILGVFPLLIARGAGAEMRRMLGTAVFSGMLGVTLFGIFLTPVFFNVIDWLGQTGVFASAKTRLLGKIVLMILGFVMLLPLGVWMLWRFAGGSRPDSKPAGNSDEQTNR